jgi:hypothetical protein
MDPKTIRSKRGPEGIIQDALRNLLVLRGWWVKRIIGMELQSGLPDLYIAKRNYGTRWVEVKLPHMEGSRFTPAQLETFPRMTAEGVGIWILTAANEEEYNKLFKPPNWYQYLDVFR